MQRVFDFLRFDDIPLVARRVYAAELPQITLWGVVAGAIDGYIAGIVASKTFNASEAATTLTWALPLMINVLNPVWSVVLRGRRRLRTFAVLSACAAAGIFSVSFTSPRWEHADWIFAAQVGFIHLFLSGIITLRTTIWRANYPHTHRARIAGRLQTVRMLLVLVTGATLTALFDRQAWAYHYIYPAVSLIGLLSLWPLSRMRVRGERRDLRYHRERLTASGQASPGAARELRDGFLEALGILRTDRMFAQYMAAQFLLGSANFFTEPLLINIVTRRFGFDYFRSALITTLIPTTVMLITIRFWAPLFDRIGVLRFRIYNSMAWALSYVGVTTAMLIVGLGGLDLLPVAIVILCLARVTLGVGRGGGAIAWNIGHLHFAPKHQTELYMGIHVGLTGVRALLMPFIGLACILVLGYGSFAVACVLAFSAHLMFRRLARLDARTKLSADGFDDDPPPASRYPNER